MNNDTLMTSDRSEEPARLTYAVHNLEVWARALIVLRELAARGIPVIVLKSLPQVEDLYSHVGGRATGDVDLIVPAERGRRCTGHPEWHGPSDRFLAGARGQLQKA